MRLLRQAIILALAICVWQPFCPALRAAVSETFAVVDGQTGYVLLEQGGRDKRQIASLTKIATACVVLDWAEKKGGDLNQVVPIAEQSFLNGERNEIGWQPGDNVSLRDLLYAALVQSDNIAANVLANQVGESLVAVTPAASSAARSPTLVFVAQMNALARQLRMERTMFANPTGFDQKERPIPYSTAFDLARLTRYAMNKASFRFYVSQKEREIVIGRAGHTLHYLLHSTNELLGNNGIDGVKTGSTARAGDCLILSANRESEIVKQGETTSVYPRHLFVVLLASPDRFGNGEALVTRGWQLYDAWAAGGRLPDPKRTL